jgi:glycerophosphoryl diester phosphodiesterase
MINFEEELKKFHPSLEVEDAEEAIYNQDLTDMADVLVKMVKEYGLEKQVEYISFSMNICEQLARLTPKSEIAYLKSDIAPKDVKAKGANGIDYHYKAFEKHPEWVKEAHELGMKVNVWTVNNEKDMKKMIDLNVDYITTDQPLEAAALVAGK